MTHLRVIFDRWSVKPQPLQQLIRTVKVCDNLTTAFPEDVALLAEPKKTFSTCS
jgi:hypothetical protein